MPPGWAALAVPYFHPCEGGPFHGKTRQQPTAPGLVPPLPPSPALPPLTIADAASRSLSELARAGVRAMLGFECRRAVVQEPRARHSASTAAAQLVCWRRSPW